jgi:hypothetical protein
MPQSQILRVVAMEHPHSTQHKLFGGCHPESVIPCPVQDKQAPGQKRPSDRGAAATGRQSHCSGQQKPLLSLLAWALQAPWSRWPLPHPSNRHCPRRKKELIQIMAVHSHQVDVCIHWHASQATHTQTHSHTSHTSHHLARTICGFVHFCSGSFSPHTSDLP